MLALCITLDRNDKNRARRALKSIQDMGFDRIEFVDGVKIGHMPTNDARSLLSQRALYEMTHGRYVHEGLSSPNAVGCYLAHTKCWKRIAACNDGQYVAIFEDDFYLNRDLLELYRRGLKDAIRLDLDILRLTPRHNKDLGNTDKYLTPDLRQVGRIESASGYILSCRAAKKLLAHAFPIDMQVDHYMDILSHNENMRHYRLKKSICQNENMDSKIHHPEIEMYRDTLSQNSIRRHSSCLICMGLMFMLILALLAKC